MANISIPSNLSQILASIKSKPEGGQTQLSATSVQSQTSVIKTVTNAFINLGQDEEYNPELVLLETSGKKIYHWFVSLTFFSKSSLIHIFIFLAKPVGKTSSRLAQLSEAELLSMVPDGMIDVPPVQKPQPPCTETKSRFDEPPPPGV